MRTHAQTPAHAGDQAAIRMLPLDRAYAAARSQSQERVTRTHAGAEGGATSSIFLEACFNDVAASIEWTAVDAVSFLIASASLSARLAARRACETRGQACMNVK